MRSKENTFSVWRKIGNLLYLPYALVLVILIQATSKNDPLVEEDPDAY